MNRFPTIALTVATALLAGAPASAQGPSQEELRKRYEAKLEGEWLKNAAWETDYDEARSKADQDGKILFAYFTRSYSP